MSTMKSNPILLPVECDKIQSWKVKDGSIVRKGETIALALLVPSSDSTSSASPTNKDNTPNHTTAANISPTENGNGGTTNTKQQHSEENDAVATTVTPVESGNKRAMKRPKVRGRRKPGAVISSAGSGATNSSGVEAAAGTTKPVVPNSSSSHRKASKTLGSLLGSKTATISQPVIKRITNDHNATANEKEHESSSSLSLTSKSDHKDKVSNHGSGTHTITTTTMKILSPADGFLRVCISLEGSDTTNQTNRVIGLIEPCRHPTMIGGLCAVCGKTQLDIDAENHNNEQEGQSDTMIDDEHNTQNSKQGGTIRPSLKRKHNPSSITSSSSSSIHHEAQHEALSRVTVSGGTTMSISKSEASAMAYQSQTRLQSSKKLSLVLDLDHTLVHATADPRAANEASTREDVRILVLSAGDNQNHHHYVKLRPHLKEFLMALDDLYEITIYTAGTRAYAVKVADVICRYIVGAEVDEEELNHMRGYYEYVKNAVKKVEDNKKKQEEEEEKAKKKMYNIEKSQEDADADEDDDFLYLQREEEERKAAAMETTNTNDVAISDSNEIKDTSPIEEDINLITPKKILKRKRDSISTTTPSTKNRVIFVNLPPSWIETRTPRAEREQLAAEAEAAAELPTLDELQTLKQDLEKTEKLEQTASELRQKLFGSRIVSRTDVGDLGRDVKSLKRVFPCGGTMSAIVDDREDVWANANDNISGRPGEPPTNLLLVRPYHWKRFSGYADVNNASGADLTESTNSTLDKSQNGKTKEEQDDETNEMQLCWTRDVLKRVHARFYEQLSSSTTKKKNGIFSQSDDNDRITVPRVLETMRRQVLDKDKIVLSGLVPLHYQAKGYNNGDVSRVRPMVVRYAEDLGAMVERDVTGDITHVVAARDGTDKVLTGYRVKGCAVVKISWLMECFWSLTKKNVSQHLLGPVRLEETSPDIMASSSIQDKEDKLVPEMKLTSATSSSSGSKILLSESDSSEEDDDDDDDGFAAEFETELLGGS